MKIAFLCKRHYTGHDVIADRFGRLYEIPRQLALMGHDVHGYCLDYHTQDAGEWRHETASGTLAWESYPLGGLRLPALAAYPRHLLRRMRTLSPDIVIGASDIPHAALAEWLSRHLAVPCAIDLYDNFESFGQARIPGIISVLRHAVRNANLVTVVSGALKHKVEKEYHPKGTVLVMPNGVDRNLFARASRDEARRYLGLPMDAELVGTAGNLSRGKGIDTMYSAWSILKQRRPNTHLVLAGSIEKRFPPPSGTRVHYLGQLPYEHMPALFNALDVGVITIENSPFGRYCFPQKAHEMLSCGLPIVASRVGVMSELLASQPRLLYPPGDAQALSEAIHLQLENSVIVQPTISGWPDLVYDLELKLKKLCASRHAPPQGIHHDS